MVWIILDGQIEGLLWNSFILLLCQRHYQTLRPRQKIPYVRKPYLVTHEIHFQEGQPGFGQRRPKIWTYLTWLIFQGLI